MLRQQLSISILLYLPPNLCNDERVIKDDEMRRGGKIRIREERIPDSRAAGGRVNFLTIKQCSGNREVIREGNSQMYEGINTERLFYFFDSQSPDDLSYTVLESLGLVFTKKPFQRESRGQYISRATQPRSLFFVGVHRFHLVKAGLQ